MKRKAAYAAAAVGLLLLHGCSKTDQERAHERAAEAKEKTRDELHRLGTEAKQDARRLDQKLGQALKGTGTDEASHKLDTAAHEARLEAQRAGRKLDQAATIGRVKAKLASDAGLSTISNVSVGVSGSVVTLDGTVTSADQKHAVEQSAASVDGVTKVVDNLQVEP